MSSRNLRKLLGNSMPLHNSDESDGDYDPFYVSPLPKSTFAGLYISPVVSDNEATCQSDEGEDTEYLASKIAQGARPKKPQKKKGKGKKTKPAAVPRNVENIFEQIPGTSSTVRPAEELDEIDKSILEINALLGAPPPAPDPKPTTDLENLKSVIEVQTKHLNVANELKKLFGPEEPEEVRLRTKLQPHRIRIQKRIVIQPSNSTPIYDFKKTGLSMAIEKREDDITYFVYVHDADLQKRHRVFLECHARHSRELSMVPLNMDESRRNMHVEPLLEIADTLFRMEENSVANELVENVMTYLQYVAHPSFNLSRTNVRLLYTYLENRPFFVAMLKYMYLLTNRACHRTALEVAKVILNIDPSDPLAVMFVIDTLALRAREHKWLIDAVEYFNKERQVKLLFNIQYSYALAHYHVAVKNKQDFDEADKYLRIAIMSNPRVVIKILEFANMKDPKIHSHVLFTNEPESDATEGLDELIMVYARLTWSRWREPQVIDWFVRNAIQVTENYDNSEDIRNEAKELNRIRYNIFQKWPTQILRHISIIDSMSNLLLETTLNMVSRPASGWDPLFENGINRYNYRLRSDPLSNVYLGRRALLYRFFTSIMPDAVIQL